MGRGIPVDVFGTTKVADGRADGGISGGGDMGDSLAGISMTGDAREGGANSGFVGRDEDDADEDSGGVAPGARCGIVDEEFECVVFAIRPRSFWG